VGVPSLARELGLRFGAMEFRILGPLEVSAGDGALKVGGPKQRAVLAHLILRANRPVPVDLLIDGLWGEEPPETAKNTLQTNVYRLRQLLGEDRIASANGGYVLRAEPSEIDAARFEALVRAAKAELSTDPSKAADELARALTLWRGSPLADLSDEPSLRGEIARLEELHLSATEHRIAAEIAVGGHSTVVSELEALTGVSASEEVTVDELQLALRNHGMHLEGLSYDLTPPGMHYLLIHFDVPDADEATWSLSIGGLVRNPIEVSMVDLRARPMVTLPVTMECAGNGRARLSPRPISQPWLTEAIGTAAWTGTPLRPLLEEAGVTGDAVEILFTGADRGIQGEIEHDYQRSLTIADAMRDEVLLAYEMNGLPLPPQHGFPLRLVVPGWYGMTSVKWLTGITAVAEPFEGYQQVAYRFRQQPEDDGEPVTRMRPRSLMIPPGIPEFMTRRRFVDAGTVELEGRAWSGSGPIERIEVSSDGGASWADADLGEPASPYAWTPWTYAWDAEPGAYELSPRATDAEGNTQPLEQPWNLHGFANNMVQRVPVEVRG
jgi:DMSO/TMAO reductase YedYZ molybdopterin-dependent catalytic subunit/DNA-binding winged helix-turn-helix (wHTH) protein